MLRNIFTHIQSRTSLYSLVQIRPISKSIPPPNCPNDNQATKFDFDQFRSDNRIKIVKSSEDVPDPILDFENSGFSSNIIKSLERSGFEQPMPIQAQGWPIALNGSDMIAIGETGSGKTLGFLLPAFMHINKVNRENPGKDPICLVLAPTRELVQQIENVARTYGKGVWTTSVFGGASRMYQARQLQRNTDILVATPGRLIDLLESDMATLNRISYVVLDEADRMLDMGFEPQLRRILEEVPANRQMLMWSATWPKEVESLAKDFLQTDSNSYVHLNIGSIDLQANQNIEQVFEILEDQDKRDKLIEIAQEHKHEGKILIFANTKKSVDYIVKILHRYDCRSIGIHGDKTQGMRDNALSRFRSGSYNFLVATDVASRGLDVDDIKLVINYDMPTNTEDYIHRIGRTGRSGRKGKSVSLVDKFKTSKSFHKELISILKEAKQDIPEELANMNQFSEDTKRKSRNSNQFWRNKYDRDYRSQRRYASLDEDDIDEGRSYRRQNYDSRPRRYENWRNSDRDFNSRPRRYENNWRNDDEFESRPRRYERQRGFSEGDEFESRPRRYVTHKGQDFKSSNQDERPDL